VWSFCGVKETRATQNFVDQKAHASILRHPCAVLRPTGSPGLSTQGLSGLRLWQTRTPVGVGPMNSAAYAIQLIRIWRSCSAKLRSTPLLIRVTSKNHLTALPYCHMCLCSARSVPSHADRAATQMQIPSLANGYTTLLSRQLGPSPSYH
jgi:hypothetical protein